MQGDARESVGCPLNPSTWGPSAPEVGADFPFDASMTKDSWLATPGWSQLCHVLLWLVPKEMLPPSLQDIGKGRVSAMSSTTIANGPSGGVVRSFPYLGMEGDGDGGWWFGRGFRSPWRRRRFSVVIVTTTQFEGERAAG